MYPQLLAGRSGLTSPWRTGWQWQPKTYEGDDFLTGISHDPSPPITIDAAVAAVVGRVAVGLSASASYLKRRRM